MSSPNSYFVPGYGISRPVIQNEIRYLCGPDAIVRPYTHQGRDGFLVTTCGRPLTKEQIEDLKVSSQEYEAKQSRRAQEEEEFLNRPIHVQRMRRGWTLYVFLMMVLLLSDVILKAFCVFLCLFSGAPYHLSWSIIPYSIGTLFGTTLFSFQRYTFSEIVHTDLRTSRCFGRFQVVLAIVGIWQFGVPSSWCISTRLLLPIQYIFAFKTTGIFWCAPFTGSST